MSGDILARLQAAQSEAEREWVVLEFSLDGLAPALREAVWAAAVPHWFDAAMLAALLDKPLGEAEALVAELANLSFVEPFPDRGYNIHQRTRTLLLERLWDEERKRYQELSRRAAVHCAGQDHWQTAWRVETIYHVLIADPDRGASQLKETGREWHNSPYFAYDKVDAMARAGREHVDAARLSVRSVGWTLFWEALLDVDYSRPQAAMTKLQIIEIEVEEELIWLPTSSS